MTKKNMQVGTFYRCDHSKAAFNMKTDFPLLTVIIRNFNSSCFEREIQFRNTMLWLLPLLSANVREKNFFRSVFILLTFFNSNYVTMDMQDLLTKAFSIHIQVYTSVSCRNMQVWY